MNVRDMYRDVLGSAGLSVSVLYRIVRSANTARVVRVLNNFIVNGRIKNSYSRQKHKELFIPKSLVIEPTFRCNMECTDCYSPKDTRLMSAEMFESIISQSTALGVYRFVLMGGEPTLDEVLHNILPAIKKHKNCIFTFCTNCTLINQDFVDRFSGINNVAFLLSAEGTKEATERRRGKGAYDKYLDGISILRKHKMAFAMSMTIDPDLWETQIDEEVIKQYVEAGGTIIYSYQRFDAEKKTFNEIPRIDYLKQIQHLCKKYPIYWGDGRFGKMKSHKGIIPRDNSQVCIDPDGNIRPLRFFYEPVFGNLKDRSLKEILADKAVVDYKHQARVRSNKILENEVNELNEKGFKIFKYKSA